MLNIKMGEEVVNVDYEVENNLIPTTKEAIVLTKKILFADYVNRINSPNNYYNVNLRNLLGDSNHRPAVLNIGHIDVLDDEGNLLGSADLYSAYSGTDTARGTINLVETKHFTHNCKVCSKIVIDFPTHACNGKIKTIRLNSSNKYNSEYHTSNSKTYEIDYSNYKVSGYTSFQLCFDGEGNRLIVDTNLKHIVYNDEVYSYEGIQRVFHTGNEWVAYRGVTNANTQNRTSKFTLTKLVFDEEKKEISYGEDLVLTGANSYSTSTSYSLELLAVKKVDDNYVAYIRYTGESNRYTSFVTYDLEGNFVSQTSWSYNSNAVWSYTNIDLPLNENGDYPIILNTSYSYIPNFRTKQVVTTDKNITKNLWNGGSGYCPKGVHYRMKSANDNKDTNGYGNHTKIMRDIGVPYKYPLVITLNEPIEKTNDQTFKINLNVEIE